jgi:hypothetical protein
LEVEGEGGAGGMPKTQSHEQVRKFALGWDGEDDDEQVHSGGGGSEASDSGGGFEKKGGDDGGKEKWLGSGEEGGKEGGGEGGEREKENENEGLEGGVQKSVDQWEEIGDDLLSEASSLIEVPEKGWQALDSAR